MNGKQMIKIERPLRKRGRPQGKGRAPLSMEERRARNAQYEKERRMETADAMAELAAALGCSEMTNSDLIATAITFLRKANVPDPSQDIQSLKRINENLIMQIQSVEERLVRECQLAGCAITDLSNSEDDSVSVRTNSNNEGRKKLKLNVSGAVLSSPNPGQSYRQLENTRRQAFKTEPTSQTETSLRTKRTFEMQQSLKPEPVAKIQNPYFTMQPIFKAEQALNSEQVIKTEPFLYPWAAYPSASPESFDCTSSDTPIPPVYSDSTIYMEPCFKAQPILEAREALNSELAIKMEPMLSPGVPYQSTSQESFDCSTSENSQTSIAASRGYDEFRRSDTQTFPSETVAGLDGAFDGVLDFMRHWTVEDFIEEYL